MPRSRWWILHIWALTEQPPKIYADLPIEEQTGLLDAPYLPFDGMNEYGLAIGMAAVPPGNMRPDADKETIGSLGIIRQMLDHARTVDEAVDIMTELQH